MLDDKPTSKYACAELDSVASKKYYDESDADMVPNTLILWIEKNKEKNALKSYILKSFIKE